MWATHARLPINCCRYRIRILVTPSGTSFGLSVQSRHVPFSFSVEARLTSSGKRRRGQKRERASKLPCYHCPLQAATAPPLGDEKAPGDARRRDLKLDLHD